MALRSKEKRTIGVVRADISTSQFLLEQDGEDADTVASVYRSASLAPRGKQRNADEIESGYPRVWYDNMKTAFEEAHFYDITSDRLVEVTPDGSLLHMKHPHAESWLAVKWRLVRDDTDFMKGYLPFYKLWLKDPDRRCARAISRRQTTNPDEFYVPFKFAWTSSVLDEDACEHQLALYQNLVAAASTCLPSVSESYLHDYFAHMLQHPLDLPGVAVIITGAKGCGKETLLNFVLRALLGPALGVNYDNVQALFNTYDTGSMHKVAVKVEELSSKFVRPFAKQLRSLITAETRVFNPKNGTILHGIANYNRFLGTANEDCPVPMFDDHQADRRFLILRMSPTFLKEPHFFEEVYDVERGLSAPSAGAAVGAWLMSRDLSGFNPRRLPKVDAHRDAFERSPLQMYVEDGWSVEEDWRSTKQVWEAAKTFCRVAGIDSDVDLKDTVSLGRALAIYVGRGLVVKTSGHARSAYYRLPAGASGVDSTAEEAQVGSGNGGEVEEDEVGDSFYLHELS